MKHEKREVVKYELWFRFTDDEIDTIQGLINYYLGKEYCVNDSHVNEFKKYLTNRGEE